MDFRQRASGLWVPEDRRICRLDRDRDRDRDGASVRAAAGGGGGGGGGSIDALVSVASLVIDWPRGNTAGPYQLTTGTDAAVDGGECRSCIPEKSPSGMRWGDTGADYPSWHTADPMDGAGVVRLGGDSDSDSWQNVSGLAAILSQTKWWFFLKGRMRPGTYSYSFQKALAAIDGNSGRLTVLYTPSTGAMILRVHNGTTAADYTVGTVAAGEEWIVAGYYDGTDLHLWLNSAEPATHAGTGILGSLDSTWQTRLAQPAAWGEAAFSGWEFNSVWVGSSDDYGEGADKAAHLLNMQALVDDRIPA